MLSSLGLDAQLDPEVVTPVQFQILWSHTIRTSPEKALCVAMILQAASDLELFRDDRSARSRRLYADARDWLASDARSHPFSFASICDVLGLSAAAIRAALIAPAERNLLAA
jgi:hypothetical protein